MISSVYTVRGFILRSYNYDCSVNVPFAGYYFASILRANEAGVLQENFQPENH